MEDNPESNLQIYASDLLIKNIQLLQLHASTLLATPNIEAIHDIRVACRRSRSVLKTFSANLPSKTVQKWDKSLQNTGKVLGKIRDLDVQIEFIDLTLQKISERKFLPGIARIELRLKQRRESLMPKALTTVQTMVSKHVLTDMEAKLLKWCNAQSIGDPPSSDLLNLAQHELHARLAALIQYEDFVYQPEQSNELHRMRIAAKWLRYTMEQFNPLYQDTLSDYIQHTRLIQDSLGQLHDLDVWLQFLPQFMIEEKRRSLRYYGNLRAYYRLTPGFDNFSQHCLACRRQTYQEFVAFWEQLKTQNIWPDLSTKIDTLLNNASLSPTEQP